MELEQAPTVADVPEVAFSFDRGFHSPTMVALVSLMKSNRHPVSVHLHPTEDIPVLSEDVDRIAGSFSNLAICIRPIRMSDYSSLPDGRRPLAARARLLLPNLHSGRVIYLDGDVLVRKDIRPLWRTDLTGRCIAAVRTPGQEFDLLKAKTTNNRRARERAEKIRRQGLRLDGVDMDRYFNSGVMLMDMDAINARGLTARMQDIKGTAQYTSRDQDWLNMVFRNQTVLIDPTWNSGWGNPKSQKSYIPKEARAAYAESRDDPAIIHFTGGEKPWDSTHPPFRLHLVFQSLQRRLRAKYWQEFQTCTAQAESIVGRRLFK